MATPVGNAANVQMGVCTITYKSQDLGYTKGGVKVSYSTESLEKKVDQEDAPIGEIITNQKFEVKVPLAEYDLTRLASILPNAQLVTDKTTPTKKKLVLTGAAGANLLTLSGELILKPMDGTANDWITVHHACPIPSLEFAYEKENIRIYEVTFKALKGTNGFVTFGDVTATAV